MNALRESKEVSSSDDTEALAALRRAIEICGGQTAFAKKINEWRQTYQPSEKRTVIKQGHVWKWLNVTGMIQIDCVLAAEGSLNGQVTRYEFRPDIYGANPMLSRRRHDDPPHDKKEVA